MFGQSTFSGRPFPCLLHLYLFLYFCICVCYLLLCCVDERLANLHFWQSLTHSQASHLLYFATLTALTSLLVMMMVMVEMMMIMKMVMMFPCSPLSAAKCEKMQMCKKVSRSCLSDSHHNNSLSKVHIHCRENIGNNADTIILHQRMKQLLFRGER